MKEQLLQSLISRVGIVRTKSVLNPLLWLTAFVLITFLPAAGVAGFSSAVGIVLVAIAILAVLVTLGAYVYFAIKNPDRLQSEEFLLRQQELHAYAKEGGFLDMRRVEQLPNPIVEGETDSTEEEK